jgi:hypothetical protein
MIEKTNYIIHLNSAFEKICEDDRLTPFHISLYFSLFQYWNIAKFRNPISISRDEMMRAAKIGSVNTYIRCMKELDAWQYIQYHPSFNPQKGSQVYLFTFNKASNNTNHKTNNNASNISTDNSLKKTDKKTSDKTTKTQLSPSINSSNNTNKLNSKKKDEYTRTKNNSKSSSTSSIKKVAQKKEVSLSHRGEGRKGEGKKPTLLQLETHFATKEWPAIEAQKFFNYYQSNGWLVGGKTPMQSWKACASNWMLNSIKFNNGKTKPKAGNLHTTTDKNYGEPL